MAIHEAAAVGFERQSGAYAKARPSYHPLAVDSLVEALGVTSWVEAGAGTGKATAALVERGVEVVAVEPVAAMRAALAEKLPAVTVLDGTSERMPVADATAAIVLAAQAMHWFDHGPTLDEFSRILKPGGAVVTLWNARDQSVPWVAEYTKISNRHAGDTPRWHTMVWREALERDARFQLEGERAWPNPQPSSPDLVVSRLLSTSFIGALDAETQEGLAAEVRELVKPLGEAFEYPYITEFQIWRFHGAP